MSDIWESFQKIPTTAAVVLVGLGLMIALRKRRSETGATGVTKKAGNKRFVKNLGCC